MQIFGAINAAQRQGEGRKETARNYIWIERIRMINIPLHRPQKDTMAKAEAIMCMKASDVTKH